MEYELGGTVNFVDDVVEHSAHDILQNRKGEPGAVEGGGPREGGVGTLGGSQGVIKKHHDKYGSAIQEIQKQHGGLEDMRVKLNISRKQICDFLMVDPSAWSRWTAGEKGGDRSAVPPHVYRTMALIMASSGVQADSAFTPATVRAVARVTTPPISHNPPLDEYPQMNQALASQNETLREKLETAQKQNEKFEVLTMGWKIILILNSVFILYVLFR